MRRWSRKHELFAASVVAFRAASNGRHHGQLCTAIPSATSHLSTHSVAVTRRPSICCGLALTSWDMHRSMCSRVVALRDRSEPRAPPDIVVATGCQGLGSHRSDPPRAAVDWPLERVAREASELLLKHLLGEGVTCSNVEDPMRRRIARHPRWAAEGAAVTSAVGAGNGVCAAMLPVATSLPTAPAARSR